MKSLTGGQPEELLGLMARAMLRAGIHSGEYYEASNTKGELVGFLMTMPPGQDIFSTSVSSVALDEVSFGPAYVRRKTGTSSGSWDSPILWANYQKLARNTTGP